MNREILFRGKRWDNGKWATGDLLQYQDGRTEIHSYVEGCRQADEVDHRTIGQYTGLQDKTGVKIFEGDILRFRNLYDEEYETAAVVWYGESGYTAFDLKEHQFECNGLAYIVQSGDYEYKVIGNIHDNPELLEVTP